MSANAEPSVSGKIYFVALLMDVTLPESHELIYVHAIFVGLALLFLFCSDIFVRCCHRPDSAHVNSSPTITNTIPFSTLNISIALTLLADLTMKIFAITHASKLLVSLLLVGFILTNKKARKHLQHRLRQKIDTFTIGRGNSVQPVVSVALVQLPVLVAGVSPIPIRNNHP